MTGDSVMDTCPLLRSCDTDAYLLRCATMLTAMADWAQNLLWIGLTIFIVLLNGFFVAAEFAMVKVRRSQVEEMVRSGTAFATTLSWLMQRLEPALSACQLGITMASLALGWIGEPAIASLIEPLFVKIGIGSAAVVHVVAFIIAFTIITTAHLVIGEQVPKIYAIRRADRIALLCAWPLKIFYIATLPLLVALNRSTSMILAWLGIGGMSEHDSPHSEEEIRALLAQSHLHGELTKSEHHLLDAVFIFGETVARQIMLPRIDIDFLDVNDPIATSIDKARLNKHTR
ncbi:MAG: hemolysin family protein, partial [Phycisphaerales bacterium]